MAKVNEKLFFASLINSAIKKPKERILVDLSFMMMRRIFREENEPPEAEPYISNTP